ncbi:hypothetical protein BDV25DRAFT_165044 [Aspergillus avenaceus]|uniref:Uncharacterized protein n=1 Tax=Aspergillus avenaceus TaxID=36643 RepID=A0A5N6TG21_ASPAV|nr:hypothetical protein BDV25DRAFT_165044 [Aspergillus avenaceus]
MTMTITITITLHQTITLTNALITLKCLHMIAYLVHSPRDRTSPITRAIMRREQLITDIFLSIMPESVLRSSSTAILQSPGPDIQDRCRFPETLYEATTEDDESRDHLPLRRCGSILPVPTMNGGLAGAGVPVSSGGGGNAAAPPSSSRSCSSLRRGLAVVRGSRASRRGESSPVQYARVPTERPRLSFVRRLWSIDSAALAVSEETHAILEMEEGAAGPSCSVESFPGNFPKSDALGGPYLNARGVTSVRPFSDL